FRPRQRSCRARRRAWRRHHSDRSELRARQSGLFPHRRFGRRPRQHSRPVRRGAPARHRGYRVQISGARARRLLHLCAHHGGAAVAAARSVRAGAMKAAEAPGTREAMRAAFDRRHRFRIMETLPWLVAIAAYFVLESYLALGAQILATILFGLSVDLVLGYAGIITLGHAAFFGVGAYTAGILAANGWGEPLTGLLAAALVAGVLGIASGAIILRTTGLTLLMQTLVVATMLLEAANKATRITGGADGLQGMDVWSIFGVFRFDLFGRTAYLYCLVVLFLCWLLTRRIVHSPFGLALNRLPEN